MYVIYSYRNGENVDGVLLKSLLRMLTDLQVNMFEILFFD